MKIISNINYFKNNQFNSLNFIVYTEKNIF